MHAQKLNQDPQTILDVIITIKSKIALVVLCTDRQKIKEFINYQQQVLNLVTQGAMVSSENIDRLETGNQGWEVLVRACAGQNLANQLI